MTRSTMIYKHWCSRDYLETAVTSPVPRSLTLNSCSVSIVQFLFFLLWSGNHCSWWSCNMSLKHHEDLMRFKALQFGGVIQAALRQLILFLPCWQLPESLLRSELEIAVIFWTQMCHSCWGPCLGDGACGGAGCVTIHPFISGSLSCRSLPTWVLFTEGSKETFTRISTRNHRQAKWVRQTGRRWDATLILLGQR